MLPTMDIQFLLNSYSFKKLVTKRPVQQVAPVAPPTNHTSPHLKSPSAKKKEGTSPLLHLKKGKQNPLYVSCSGIVLAQ